MLRPLAGFAAEEFDQLFIPFKQPRLIRAEEFTSMPGGFREKPRAARLDPNCLGNIVCGGPALGTPTPWIRCPETIVRQHCRSRARECLRTGNAAGAKPNAAD